jgi:hypothetical protein
MHPQSKLTKRDLRKIGKRPNVIQIVPPRHVVRPVYLSRTEKDDHELVTRPLASPTGPGAAAGFQNVAGSQIAAPVTMNIYMGPFWGDQGFVEGFSQAIVENGYLDPLKELGYRTGPGTYLGNVAGRTLNNGDVFTDDLARTELQNMLDGGVLHPDTNALYFFILPDGVLSQMSDGSQSCSSYCGYHDCISYQGVDVAYAVLPSSQCDGCGGQVGDFTAVYAHELAEACTDKVPGKGWVADDGEEDGDLEAWILFGWGPPADPNRYTIQGYYTNERGNTVGAWRDA